MALEVEETLSADISVRSKLEPLQAKSASCSGAV